MHLLYYRPRKVILSENNRLAGIEKFAQFFNIYGTSVAIVDRTNTIRLPVATTSLFPMPKLRPFSKTYEELCDARASELLARADSLDVKIYVSWSGGIDSTLVLISLLKQATPKQKERLVVILSEESITENPRFWEDHIHGKLQVDSAVLFSYRLGTNDILVDGEHNDQLFGSDMVAKLINKFGAGVLHKPYSRDTFFSLFGAGLPDTSTTNFYLDLFERLMAASPTPITTNFLYLWWINFALKWQVVHLRRLLHVAPRNVHIMTQEYLDTRYVHFFGTEDFQMWSLTNPDKRIKDRWDTYKWPAKDVIYDYTKDSEYRDHKTKRGSLRSLLMQQHSYSFIDDRLSFYDALPPEQYYEPNNDFI